MSRKRSGYYHIGGSTLLIGGGKFPSDDIYQHSRTGDFVITTSKVNVHLDLPEFIDGPYQLRRRKGVGCVIKMTRKEYLGN
jgi:hypothetical protein